MHLGWEPRKSKFIPAYDVDERHLFNTSLGTSGAMFCYPDAGATTMKDTMRRVLNLFAQMNTDTLDLHTLFEAGGNDPDARGQVLDVVTRLVGEGLLEECGSDFYRITTKGRSAAGNTGNR